MGCHPSKEIQVVPSYLDNDHAMHLMSRTVLTLGKTGVGKSSLGNLIAGNNVFAASSGTKSMTREAKLESAAVKLDSGTYLFRVMDTPGFKDTDSMDDNEVAQLIAKALSKDVTELNLVFLVCSMGRYTMEEADVMSRLMNFLGDEMRSITYLVFTHCEGIPFEDAHAAIRAETEGNPMLEALLEFVEHKVIATGMLASNHAETLASPKLLENIRRYQRGMRELLPSYENGLSVSLTAYHAICERRKISFIMSRMAQQVVESGNPFEVKHPDDEAVRQIQNDLRRRRHDLEMTLKFPHTHQIKDANLINSYVAHC